MAKKEDYNYLFCKDNYEDFSKMCEKAQIMFFNYLLTQDDNFIVLDYDFWLIYNLTPIEQIFYTAYRILITNYDFEIKHIQRAPIRMIFNEEMYIQSHIQYKDKDYRVDFEFNLVKRNKFYKLKNEYKYAIELDGFNYHSNKEQMQSDYERENNLKELGYNVIRFTGSQVYNKPFECAEKVINIIMKDLKKEIKCEC